MKAAHALLAPLIVVLFVHAGSARTARLPTASIAFPAHSPGGAARMANQPAASPTPAVLISALLPNGFEPASPGHPAQPDEAIQLTNAGDQSVRLDEHWRLRDQDGHEFALAPITLTARSSIWLAHDPAAFAHQFGFAPALSYGGVDGELFFADQGGVAQLVNAWPIVMDTANDDGTMPWPAGSGSPSYFSMERRDTTVGDVTMNWANSIITGALDGGVPVTGTPRARNSTAVSSIYPTTRSVVINEVAWGGTRAYPSHEWIELYNNLTTTVPLTGWVIDVAGKAPIVLSGTIAPHGYFLVTNNFTFSSGPTPDQVQQWSNLSNGGEVLRLTDTRGRVADTLVYGSGTPTPGWAGPSLQPYMSTPAVTSDGLVFMRKLNPATGMPTQDTDTAQDWVNDSSSTVSGRRGVYPGWDFARFAAPVSATSAITIAVAPDGSFETLWQTLVAAQRTIDIEMYTFEHARLADLLALKASQGITVRVLLEGAPVGGVSLQERWSCQRINTSVSGCWFMHSDAANDIHARYLSIHAKLAIIDGRQIVVSSENFGSNSFPDDEKRDGTAGHRGMLAVLDAPALVARAQEIFDADISAAHRDITRWCASDCIYGPPTPGFSPDYRSGGISATAHFSQPLYVRGPVTVELSTSPESNLRTGGILGILNSAGAGDLILLEQLDEPHYWGPVDSNPVTDPNPRLAALLGAAARGAQVFVLLDNYYDDVTNLRSNRATADYLNNLARTNRWNLRAAIGNPTGLGIHNKLIAARVGARKFVQIGSWNGSETSAKRNREMSVLIESAAVFDYARQVFFYDFWLSQPLFMPDVAQRYAPPVPIAYPLISEVMIDPNGADAGREWIELYNPTNAPYSLNGYKIGDAEAQGRFEGMYSFPPNAVIPPHSAIIIAEDALAFTADYGIVPHYAINSYNPAVPVLVPYAAWADGTLELGNSGDQVLLLGPNNAVVDAAAWISNTLPGTLPFSGPITPGHTLERYPADKDTNDCNHDFHDQPFPSPGVVPANTGALRRKHNS